MLTIILKENPQPINIINEETLHKYYDDYCQAGFLEKVWKSPNLSGFEKTDCTSLLSRELVAVMEQGRGKTGRFRCLCAALCGRAEERVQLLENVAEPFIGGEGRRRFWENDGVFLTELLDKIIWSEDTCLLLYEYLLLFLQMNRGRKPMLDCEREVLMKALYRKEKPELSGRIISPDGSGGICFLGEDGIYNVKYKGADPGTPEKIFEADKKIQSFTLYDGRYILAADVSGTLLSQSGDITAKWKSRNCPPVRSVVSFGRLYQILTENGQIITNISGFEAEVSDVRQISAGLNSLGVITGAERIPYATFGALTDSQKKEINGAREIRTRAEADPERIFWLVLKEDRSLLYSDGKDITALKDVEKADLHRRGVFYVQNHVLWMYDYNKGKRELVSRDINGKVRELFCENDGGKTNVYLWQEGKKIPDKITL